MYYIIYKITNQINGKYYIGKHQTKNLNDGYMGSGKLLKRSISKHGIENFVKEILHIFDNKQDMNKKEAEIVNEDFVIWSNTYNVCIGGEGGFSYINENYWTEEKRLEHNKKITKMGDPKFRNKLKNSFIKGAKISYEKNKDKFIGAFKGKVHSEETKQKMRKPKNQGSKNSQFGTMWITNGKENKKIRKEELDFWTKKGYTKGRKIKRD